MNYTAERLIEIALAEVGYLEKKSNSQLDDKAANAGYNNWTKYARDLYAAGYYNGNKNGYAWCDVWVDWLFLQLCNGDAKKAEWMICQTGDYGAGCGYSMRYYKAQNRFYTSPKPGDQIFFGTASSVAHTGIVYKVDATTVYTAEGNTSGASGVVANGGGVFKKSYPRNYGRIVGYGRPRYDGADDYDPKEEAGSTLKIGSCGPAVKLLQENLKTLGYYKSTIDSDFGSVTQSAVKAFQKAKKITVDGIVGTETQTAIDAALKALSIDTDVKDDAYSLDQFIREVQAAVGATVDGYAGPVTLSKTKTLSTTTNRTHALVRPVQKRLLALGYSVGSIDCIYGNQTKAAVKEFQKDNGCVQDGVITARNTTWKKLMCMS